MLQLEYVALHLISLVVLKKGQAATDCREPLYSASRGRSLGGVLTPEKCSQIVCYLVPLRMRMSRGNVH